MWLGLTASNCRLQTYHDPPLGAPPAPFGGPPEAFGGPLAGVCAEASAAMLRATMTENFMLMVERGISLDECFVLFRFLKERLWNKQ